MSIILHNTDKHLLGVMSLKSDSLYLDSNEPYDIKGCHGLFIDWIPTSSNRVEELVQQTEIIEEFVKNKRKIVVFDRYRSITQKEFNYLKKHKVVFWEPALFTRKGFHYQPCWINVPYDIQHASLEPFEDKDVDLGFNGNLRNKFKGLSKYYEDMHGVMDLSISLNVHDIKDDKIEELGKKDIKVEFDSLNNYKVMVLLGKPEDYVSGYLDPAFVDCVRSGVIPVLPSEHRWYHAMFDGLVIKNLSDLKTIIEQYDTSGFGMMWHLMKNIEKYHPEMTTTHVGHRISSNFK